MDNLDTHHQWGDNLDTHHHDNLDTHHQEKLGSQAISGGDHAAIRSISQGFDTDYVKSD